MYVVILQPFQLSSVWKYGLGSPSEGRLLHSSPHLFPQKQKIPLFLDDRGETDNAWECVSIYIVFLLSLPNVWMTAVTAHIN